MIDWIDVAGSLFENTMIYIVAMILAKNEKISARMVICWLIAVPVISIANSFNIPYHAIFTVAAMTAFICAFFRNKIIDTAADVIMGFAYVLFYQIIFSVVLMLFMQWFKLDENIAHFILLAIMIPVGILLFRSDLVQRLLSTYYYENREPLFGILAGFLVIYALLINVLAPEDTAYSNKKLEVLLLIGVYVILNGVFIYNLYIKRRTEKELFKSHEYEDYLHELMNQMKSREHEYKNHIQHIISISEDDEIDDVRKRIHEYADQIVDQDSVTTKGAITDNIAASIFLYQAKKRAENEEVHFEYYIDKPFPEYRIPEKDLVELVSNAINNAFEAAADLEPEKRSIFILFQKDHIEVINTMACLEDVEYGVSTKGRERGYGRLNMKRIADKYGIKLSTQIEENRFIVVMDF
ncbi:MAG: GHKL domain-containing protein [Eubacterium sp.]|nr:GHKL domain-containing protein [Eubacterium sp.]